MTWWIAGRGMLGKDLERELQSQNIDCVSSDLEVDICDSIAVASFMKEQRISAVFNCAAYTAVDKAESEPKIAWKINALGPKVLAQVCAQNKIPLLHISTDYVFDGEATEPISESEKTVPLGVYGRSKRLGEILAQRAHPEGVFVVRTSWLFGSLGNSFVSTMLRLFKERSELGVVGDQVGSPTWTRDLSRAMIGVIQKKVQPGIYHFVGNGECSWFSFAKEISKQAFHKKMIEKEPSIRSLKTEEYPTPAKRPAYSVLSTQKISDVLGRDPMDWKESLDNFLNELRAQHD